MQPDVARAIPELVERGLLPREAAPRLQRVASGRLVSVRAELRALLHAGVLLVASGAGLLVAQNLARLGPVTVAVALGLASAGCFAWVARVGPAFSRGKGPAANIAFDYILLLGVLLAGADLAWIEVRFSPLGASWPWHLLPVALLAAAAAFRWDSGLVFSVALSTFAAWAGLTPQAVLEGDWWGSPESLRVAAVACGATFVVLGVTLVRSGLKAHFAPVADAFGWLLLFGGLAAFHLSESSEAPWWAMLSLVLGGVVAVLAGLGRKLVRFGLATFAAWLAASRLAVEAIDEETLLFAWFAGSALALVVGLARAFRRKRSPP